MESVKNKEHEKELLKGREFFYGHKNPTQKVENERRGFLGIHLQS